MAALTPRRPGKKRLRFEAHFACQYKVQKDAGAPGNVLESPKMGIDSASFASIRRAWPHGAPPRSRSIQIRVKMLAERFSGAHLYVFPRTFQLRRKRLGWDAAARRV